jgi:glyceraldehyde-3-phosphate dehydrogenase (NAD(P))
MKVLINGQGNIGTTLACLLIDFKTLLGIKEVLVYKNRPQPWLEPDLEFLKSKGIKILTSKDVSFKTVITQVDYIFESTSNGIGVKNLSLYKDLHNLKGACAQGSEKDFGDSFMSGINDNQIANEKFVNIVSCNTHGAASLLKTFCGHNLSNLQHADFVVVRRSEDIGNHQRLVGANVVARHLSPITGTHHAIDVKDLYDSLGVNCHITSSDITTPSQLLHSTRFNITLKYPLENSELLKRIDTNKFLATSQKFDSNTIFELGRRYGRYGRIYNHSIVLSNNMLVDGNSIKGWAFVPQEGNSLISTLHAFLLQTKNDKTNLIMREIKNQLLISIW